MKTRITPYEEELVAKSRLFLDAADANAESCALLERFGFSEEERKRGRDLTASAELSFEWERQGRAYNFLSPTLERRLAEARAWRAERARRWVQSRFREAEKAAGWIGEGPSSHWPIEKKLTTGFVVALRELAHVASPTFWRELQQDHKKNLELARGSRPEGAPPPKDTTIVELRGWYERWHLLALRVFRTRADLLAPYGLAPGKAPPRLRGKAAQIKYGERAAGAMPGAAIVEEEAEDEDSEAAAAPPPPTPTPPRPKTLPIVR